MKKIKYVFCLLFFITFSGNAQAFDCFSSSNIGDVGPVGSDCEGRLIVDRSMLLGATFSGNDAYVSSGGTNYYFGGTNGGVFTGQITSFKNIFKGKRNFNADISYWNTSKAIDFTGMFKNARSFNQDINSWDTASLEILSQTFQNAIAFNQDLDNWNTAKVRSMLRAFKGATTFNGDISTWNVEKVINFTRAFQGARAFNQDISGWNVQSATKMRRMFGSAIAFDQDLRLWNVSRISSEPLAFAAASLSSAFYPCWGLSRCPTPGLSLSSSSPADDSFDVPTSATLSLNFDKNVYATSAGGSILLYKTDGTLVDTFNVKDSSKVTISGSQVSVALNLDANTDYYINISAGAFSSLARTSMYEYPGILNNYSLDFSTRSSDTTAPTLTSSSPQDDATDTQYQDAVLTLGFSEDIVIGTGDINLYNGSGLVKAYDVTDTNFVSLSSSTSLELSLVDDSGDSVLSPETAYYFLIDSGIVKDASDNVYAGISSNSTLNFTTNATYCGCISGNTRQRNERPLAGVTVNLLNSSGTVLQSTVSDANGFYKFIPTTSGSYTVQFDKKNGRPVVGQASYEDVSSSGSNLKNIIITTSCEDYSEIDGLLVDPKGIIYDSETRLPISNATVELLLNGSVIDDSFLDTSESGGGAASQVTGSDGDYSFILKADTATSGTYEIRVTPPTGYRFESNNIPADTLYTSAIGNGNEEIQPQSTAPATGDDTTYHLKFMFTFSTIAGQSSQGIVNNHIPVDSDPTTKADVKAMVESWISIATKFPQDTVRSISDRLNWLERNKNSNKQSYQGIKLRHHDEKIDQMLTLKPKAIETILTNHISPSSLDQNSVVDIAKDVALNELISLGSDRLGSINFKFKPVYNDWSMWTAGEIHLGQVNSTSTSSEQDSRDLHIIIGFDKKNTNEEIIGWSFAFGKYEIDIGTQGTNVDSNNFSLSGYRTLRLHPKYSVEMIVGYSHLNFDTYRIDQSQTLTGSRNANQIFTSITLKNFIKIRGINKLNVTPYGNIYGALTEFEKYSESGGSNAITFNDQRLEHTKVSLGLDIDYIHSDFDYFISPYFNLELSKDLSHSSTAVMRYNNSNTEYNLPIENSYDESLTIGLGFDIYNKNLWKGSFDFSREQFSKSNYRNSVSFNFNLSF